MSNFDSCLHEVTAFLREPLVSAEKVEQLKGRGRDLPGELAAFYLECRLSPPAPEVDVLALVARRQLAVDAAARERFGHQTPDPAHAFVTQWLRGAVATASPMVWLELDDCPTGPASAFANLHVCVSPSYGRTRGVVTAPTDHGAEIALLEEMTSASLLSPAQLALLKRQLQDLQAEIRLIHVSAMAGRTPLETKIYVALPGVAFADCVGRVAGPDWAERLGLLVPWTDVELGGPTLYCDLTFRAGGCHSVGLVFSKPQVADSPTDPTKELVRSRLIQEGLCTLAQDAALAAWTAAPLRPVCGFDSSRRLERWLDLKVTLTGSRLTSKAYLGFSPRVSLY